MLSTITTISASITIACAALYLVIRYIDQRAEQKRLRRLKSASNQVIAGLHQAHAFYHEYRQLLQQSITPLSPVPFLSIVPSVLHESWDFDQNTLQVIQELLNLQNRSSLTLNLMNTLSSYQTKEVPSCSVYDGEGVVVINKESLINVISNVLRERLDELITEIEQMHQRIVYITSERPLLA